MMALKTVRLLECDRIAAAAQVPDVDPGPPKLRYASRAEQYPSLGTENQ